MSNYKVDPTEPYTCPVDKDDILFEYQLPKISKFGSKSKKDSQCPYAKLQVYLTKQVKNKAHVDPTKVLTNCSQIVVHKDTAEELNQEVIKWLPIWRSYLTNGDRHFSSTYSMLHLNYGPTVSDSPSIKPGKVYIRK